MTKLEKRKINTLVSKLFKESEALERKVAQMHKHAGHSNNTKGTGDEGWSTMYLTEGEAAGLADAAYRVKQLLDKLAPE